MVVVIVTVVAAVCTYIHTYICSSLYMPFDVDGLHFTLQFIFNFPMILFIVP